MDPLVTIVLNYYNPKHDDRLRAMTELAVRCYHAYTSIPHTLLLIDANAEPDDHLRLVCYELSYQHVNDRRDLSFAEGYNAGLQLAKTPWVVTAANDVFVALGSIEALVTAAKNTGAWMAAPYLSLSDYYAQERTRVFSKRNFEPDYLTLNLNLFPRQCLDAVGLLDEQFGGCFNDVDYCLRIRQAGGHFILTDCGNISHLGSATVASRENLNRMYERDVLKFEKKWPGAWDHKRYRLTAQPFLKGLLHRLEPALPLRWQERYRASLGRIESLIR